MTLLYPVLERLKNAIKTTILRFSDNSVAVHPRAAYKIEEGKGFSASRRFEGVAADAYVDFLFSNPPGSGKTAHIIVVDVVSLAQAHVDIYRDVSVTAPGTAVTPVNLNLGSAGESSMDVEYGGTYSLPPEPSLNTVCPGGSHIRAVGGATEVGEKAVVPEGHNILVRVTNASASATDISVKVTWWEE